jgi:polar amino acid transport system substrate-binding protein
VTRDDALAAMVPAAVSADGKLVFGTDASYPPNEFTAPDGTTIIGMDVDLGTAIAQKLGLTAEFQNSQFSGIIPGVEAGRYEMAMSSFTINDERIQTVDMVSYFSAGTSLAVAAGNPEGISPDNLCGRAVGVQAGTVQVDDVAARSQACTAAGQPAIEVTELQQQTDVTLALTSNRIVAMLADSPVVAYAVTTTNGAVEPVGEPWDTAPYGIVLGKNQDQFAEAVRGAVQALIDDGTYSDVLEKWNVSNGAIQTSEVKG